MAPAHVVAAPADTPPQSGTSGAAARPGSPGSPESLSRRPLIVVVMGVSGSGKSTVGALLATQLGCGFSDADDFHSAANKQKMHAGIPLTDADREPWLAAIRVAIEHSISAGETRVFACSALKDSYRQVLGRGDPRVVFVYLHGSFKLLQARLAARAKHFFDPALLRDQLETLQPPPPGAAIVVDIKPPPQQIVAQILQQLPPR